MTTFAKGLAIKMLGTTILQFRKELLCVVGSVFPLSSISTLLPALKGFPC